jgi:hypothetical protein
MTAMALTCINTKHIINRPPALCRLIRKTHTKKNGPRMGFSIFEKALQALRRGFYLEPI